MDFLEFGDPKFMMMLVIVAFVLMGLCWRLCAVLKTSGGNVTPLALIALGLMTAMTPRGASFSWGFGRKPVAG